MEGLASLYASSENSSDEDNAEEPDPVQEEVERAARRTSSSMSDHHDALTIGTTTNGCKESNQQEHAPPHDDRLQLEDCASRPRKKARYGVVKFLTLQEFNSSTTISSNNFLRSQPHVPGNWAGHVFVKFAPHASSFTPCSWQEAETKCLDQIRSRLELSDYNNNNNNNTGSTCAAVIVHQQMNWHVSLSRPFYLQAAFIDSFVKELEQSLVAASSSSSSSSSPGANRIIRILPQECTLLVNDDKTRSFWVWPVQPSLEDLVHIVDRILLKYKQPTYYKPAHFHISVASIPGDMSTFWNQNSYHNNSVDSKSADNSNDADKQEDESLYARITEVHCVIGNKSVSFPLSA
jgi:Uncharacterised conserved protein